MRRAGNHRGDDIAARQPSEENRQHRLQAEQGSEADEDANGHAARDGMGRIGDGQQFQRMLAQPPVYFARYSKHSFNSMRPRTQPAAWFQRRLKVTASA